MGWCLLRCGELVLWWVYIYMEKERLLVKLSTFVGWERESNWACDRPRDPFVSISCISIHTIESKEQEPTHPMTWVEKILSLSQIRAFFCATALYFPSISLLFIRVYSPLVLCTWVVNANVNIYEWIWLEMFLQEWSVKQDLGTMQWVWCSPLQAFCKHGRWLDRKDLMMRVDDLQFWLDDHSYWIWRSYSIYFKGSIIQSMHHPSIQPSTMLTGGLMWASQMVELYVNATEDTLDYIPQVRLFIVHKETLLPFLACMQVFKS